jgi:hypothetical protein
MSATIVCYLQEDYDVYLAEQEPLQEGEEKHILSVFVADESGLINRVAGVFARRGEPLDARAVFWWQASDVGACQQHLPCSLTAGTAGCSGTYRLRGQQWLGLLGPGQVGIVNLHSSCICDSSFNQGMQACALWGRPTLCMTVSFPWHAREQGQRF